MARRVDARSLSLLAATILLLAARAAWAGPWVRVESSHFVVSGNVGERRVRHVASRLEQFREVLVRVFPNAKLALRPLAVVAFDSAKAYRPYTPLREGKPTDVAGYFVGNADGGCITLQLDLGEASYPVVFHEFAHLFFAQAVGQGPVWLSEGVAEYYSTVQLVDRQQRVRIADPVPRYARLLRERFVPLRKLITTRPDAALFDDRASRALFYAESWALVHFMSADGSASRISTFLSRLSAGRSDIEAFEEAFGPLAQVEAAFRQYVRRAVYPFWQLTFATRVDAAEAPVRPLSPAEVDTTLAVPLIYQGRFDEAAGHVTTALVAAPDLAEALATSGLLELRRGRTDEAERSLRRAVSAAPGDLNASYLWAMSLVRLGSADAASLERARAALTAALPAEPPGDVLGILGVLQAQTNRPEEAEASLRRSLALSPGRRDTPFNLAQVLIRRNKFAEARTLLGTLLARPEDAAEAYRVRTELEWLTESEARAKRLGTAPLGSSAPPAAAREDGRGTPDFRTPGPGEWRQSGHLQRIDCGSFGVVLEVRTGAGSKRYHAARLEEIDFISYRDDVKGPIGCGARKSPEPVYLTWKEMPGRAPDGSGSVVGRVVAVEFLGK